MSEVKLRAQTVSTDQGDFLLFTREHHKSEILRWARVAIDLYQNNDFCTCDYEPCRCSNRLDEDGIIAEVAKRLEADGEK